MSRFDPKNREDAFCYQFKEDVRVMQCVALTGDVEKFNKALATLEAHIAAYRSKRLRKIAEKAAKESSKRILNARKKYPSLYK